ncbi:MAG: hypothetical protein ONB48_03665 [candidate division KSB1 bacterium]|nr:hypothetical protein [candidate division KSB1 bacterium]MDZ7274592.1 hypothetical protein [candidate division KSB1 bacterium]MDZ7284747.1 hypothetical protein [candidate division KSB1 bacterium]MDZ7297833.1 hypothetical protein [candidate division KSB1 bacterium]MDZ7308874.1 hypothetical protein [candidate division KSB1 bacterium]
MGEQPFFSTAIPVQGYFLNWRARLKPRTRKFQFQLSSIKFACLPKAAGFSSCENALSRNVFPWEDFLSFAPDTGLSARAAGHDGMAEDNALENLLHKMAFCVGVLLSWADFLILIPRVECLPRYKQGVPDGTEGLQLSSAGQQRRQFERNGLFIASLQPHGISPVTPGLLASPRQQSQRTVWDEPHHSRI